jgi:hypothetical protein
MKKLLFLAPFALLLAGCKGPIGSLGRVFPDGASVAIDEINMQASMTGSGSMVIKGARWTGTNGFPIPGTNVVQTPASAPVQYRPMPNYPLP